MKLALKWAFRHPEIKAVEAEADQGNAASQRVLMKSDVGKWQHIPVNTMKGLKSK